MKGLPGDITKKIILDQYPDAMQTGSMDQQNLFKALTSGGMRGLYQASLVSKHFNFFLNSEKEFQFRRVKSLLRASQREKQNEDLVMARVEDIARFDRWVLDPEFNKDISMMLLSKVLKDEQSMMWYRQMVPMAGSRNPIERKHTNIFFDISGSMGGEKAQVQASAIAAIVDKALSEKDPFGQPIHEVILFPFGSKVYEGVHVKTVEEAKKVVIEYLTKPTRAEDSTNIQACFDHHFEMIHKYAGSDLTTGLAKDRLKLKKANMILITDGEDKVNEEKIKNDLGALPQGIKTFFNLVSVQGHNKTLADIAQFSNTENSRGMATHLTPELISRFIQESSNPQVDPEAFVFDKNRKQVDGQLIGDISKLKMPTYEQPVPFERVREQLARVQGSDSVDPNGNSAIIRDLYRLINTLKEAPVSNEIKLKALADILENYTRWTGRPLEKLSTLEAEILKRLNEKSERQ